MKKLFALLLAGVMAFGMMACGNNTEEPEEKEMPADMASMAAPIDALARCMLENDLEYDPTDPEFFWTALFYFTGAYGLDHELIAEEEGTYQLQIPTPVMQEHATALFADYDDLFNLPSIMKGNISYDPDTDAYSVSRGDIGLSEMKLTSYAETEEGYAVTAELWSTGPEEELIRAYDVTLADNTYVDGIENPLYYYSVADIVPVEAEDLPDSSATVETAIFNGLADSHTAELTLPDGTVQAFQFDADSDAGKVLASLKE
ncbi:MAG: hypothetical protein IJY52_06090, partial [Anaerotignum sp.]|nr:hypothetical protein [Anaerotignum sp.]